MKDKYEAWKHFAVKTVSERFQLWLDAMVHGGATTAGERNSFTVTVVATRSGELKIEFSERTTHENNGVYHPPLVGFED